MGDAVQYEWVGRLPETYPLVKPFGIFLGLNIYPIRTEILFRRIYALVR